MMLSKTFKEFASNTSMHGVKYIVDQRNRSCERAFWAVVLVLSIASCIYMVGLLWNTFESKPTRVYTETTEAPTDVIPFPAVTICNTNIISKAKVKEFVDQLRLHNEDRETVEKSFEVLLAFKLDLKTAYNKKHLDILQKVLTQNRYTIADVVSNVSRSCDEVLVKCSWKGTVVTCGNIFRKSMTPIGYCCSFNYNIFQTLPSLGHNKKNSSRKYQPSEEYTLYPGFIMGLSVLLNPHEEKEKISYRLTNGMEVAIHHSNDYPGQSTYRKTMSTGFQTFFQVSGSSVRISEEAAILPRDKRGCVFSSERKLRYFEEYAEINCFIECQMLHILRVCGCVPYFLDFGVNKNVNLSCHCPSECVDVKYDITSFSTDLIDSKATTWSFMTDVNLTKESILLTVSFTSEVQTVYRKDVADSTIYLLASFGGIFGLFLGWSFITGAEILYYFIVRLILQRQLNNPNERRVDLHKRRRTPSFIYEPKQYLP